MLLSLRGMLLVKEAIRQLRSRRALGELHRGAFSSLHSLSSNRFADLDFSATNSTNSLPSSSSSTSSNPTSKTRRRNNTDLNSGRVPSRFSQTSSRRFVSVSLSPTPRLFTELFFRFTMSDQTPSPHLSHLLYRQLVRLNSRLLTSIHSPLQPNQPLRPHRR